MEYFWIRVILSSAYFFLTFIFIDLQDIAKFIERSFSTHHLAPPSGDILYNYIIKTRKMEIKAQKKKKADSVKQ